MVGSAYVTNVRVDFRTAFRDPRMMESRDELTIVYFAHS
jgi:hypothetical protein